MKSTDNFNFNMTEEELKELLDQLPSILLQLEQENDERLVSHRSSKHYL
ncbi:hypothetical protein [Sporomusa acidovorans]|uniref:Uncharacterized protein n=1 Tax=Sporomusa acidovorans (strain ATCC 49682 / DSM 3132 / Mol) TaxID=1123286 RepID=A0ABZ3JC21_SPOA4|nr:hypothetical protein [Sporomusa acidovorans]OZC13319.1 hypothetical protein SPACI_58150 [Sporomusa acidovorans DSM 3132]SDD96798.1 hypothetical protein SAMN04488499_100634 [Sporomusa acidovorans]